MEIEQIFGSPSEDSSEKNFIFEWLSGLFLFLLMIVFFFALMSYWFESKNFETKEHNFNDLVEEDTATLFNQSTEILQPKSIQQPLQKASQPAIEKKISQPIIEKKTSQPTIKEMIYQALVEEFQYDLSRWSAKINQSSLTIHFHNPNIFFETGSATVNSYYQNLLMEFFPRYIKVIKKYQFAITALSIEGHSSPEWRNSESQDETYFNNMVLSQNRTLSVLAYCLQLPLMESEKEWLHYVLTTHGFSSSRALKNKVNFGNMEYSRRVEFKIYTDS